MALFHLNVSSIGKSSGSSAVAAAAYRSCSQLNQYVYDEMSGLLSSFTHNYANKKGLAFSHIFAPDNLREWCYNRQSLWNKVEESETRKDGRYARDIKIALQKEFTLEQNIKILSEYIKNVFINEGIIADVNIHLDNDHNPHAHVMLTTRKLIQNEGGEWVFGNKNRLLDTKGWIRNIREEWAQINNYYFALYDIDKSITAESYETRGLGFMNSTIHEGAATHSENVTERVLDRTEHNRNVVFKNLEFIKANPKHVIMAIAKDKNMAAAVFNKESMLKVIDGFLNEIALRNASYNHLINEIRTILEAECNSLIEKSENMSLENHFGDSFGLSVKNESSYDVNQKVTEHFNELLNDIRFDGIQNQKATNIDEELEYIRQNKDKIIRSLNSKKAIFSKIDVAKLLDDYVNKNILSELESVNHDNPLINEAKIKIAKGYSDIVLSFMNSEELVKLVKKDLAGNELYTTKSQLLLEKEFLNNIEELNNKSSHVIELQEKALNSNTSNSYQNILSSKLANILPNDGKKLLERVVSSILGKNESYILTLEQEKAVQQLLSSKDIAALSGMPGTGKSTVMERVAQEYKDRGYQVFGGSLSAVAALNLGKEANIVSHTLSKWQYDWNLRNNLEEKGEKVKDLLPTLTNKTVFIVDEMSMVDLHLANYITTKVKGADSKLICIFDNNQFSSIGVSGATDKIAEVAENITLTELFRQRNTLDKDITKKLSTYKVDEAIKILDSEGRIKLGNNSAIIRQELVDRYFEKTCSSEFLNKNGSVAIISYKNEEVKELNLLVRDRLLSSGLLYTRSYNGKDKGGQEFIGSRGKIEIALDERIVFTKNHKHLGVLNGQLGKVVGIIDDKRFKVELLNERSQKNRDENKSNVVIINNEKFTHFDYGYAITAHKSQGKTYDYSYVLLDSSVGYESFNVMATRHRYNSEFYIDKNCLNDIISRKFDKDNGSEVFRGIYQDNDLLNTTNNQKAALYEMLVKRAPRNFAHDFLDYESRKEIVQIREYLEVRDAAAAIYRELLDWQSSFKVTNSNNEDNNTPNLWEYEELWGQFTKLSAQRKISAEELVENYSLYQKYIDPALINYATLAKHAGKSGIAFDYQELTNNKTVFDFTSNINQEASRDYNEIAKLIDSLVKNNYPKISKLLISKCEGLIALHQEHQLNLERLANKITSLENKKWLLESEKNACSYYCKDFMKYLDETYKHGGERALNNWKELARDFGIKEAFARVEKDPEVLGSLAGIGVGKKLAVTDKRAIAAFNLRSLSARINKYENALEEENSLNNQINHIETKELVNLKETYSQLVTNKPLSEHREKYIQSIIDNKNNLSHWIKSHKDTDIIDNYGPQKNKQTNKNITMAHSSKRSLQDYDKKPFYNKLTYAELHSNLSHNIENLTKDLLPNISNKKIEITKHAIKCGSISISLDTKTKGLWCRFSRENEKGDLFDLIRISKGLSNKQEAMDWGKSYLGMDAVHTIHSNVLETSVESNNSKEIKRINDIKILVPAPNKATSFNPEKLFMYKLKDGNKVIEDVYTYKNTKNELCGYVVRIKDLESGKKETLPVVYCESSKGLNGWRSKGFGESRPLYNEHILTNSNKPVLIVEGEKTTDSAQLLYPEFDVVTWSGGASGYAKSNWEALKGREVIIWPDNDKAGIKVAENIKTLLKEQNITEAKVVDISKIEFLPEKWDLADELPKDVRQYQITGVLLQAQNISTNQRIDKTLNDYLEHRKNEDNKDLSRTKIDSLSEYILKKEQINYQLQVEEKLTKKALQEKEILTTLDEIDIAIEARKIVHNRLEELKSVDNTNSHDVVRMVEQGLRNSYDNISKLRLTEIAIKSVVHVEQLIIEHNSQQNMNNNTAHIKGNSELTSKSRTTDEHLILSKNSLPVLALSFATKILTYENESHERFGILYSSTIRKLNKNDQSLDHSVNAVKSAFQLQIAHYTLNYEVHQQQKQASQHNFLKM